ncbi:DUF1273 domain-containing protein [Paenibacillus pinihumi]|uniref:DUF1273 domain-containing protein n=1 Tax=Paenibacillus pinihumi TaxID=669462 RepID=UPI0004101708|nr:DUF1273 domain-containing protein [Paenibacillus pinihumi]
MKNLLITGYRAHELGIYNQKHKGIAYIQKAILSRLLPLVEDGLEWVITPGQYGVDLWACEAVFALREQYPHLQLAIITAFANQEENWKEERKEYYEDLILQADYYGSVSNQPYTGIWQFRARDELLFRKTDGILLVYDEDAGEGSPKFIKEQALRKNAEDGYVYIGISAEDIQNIANEEAYEAADDYA